MKKLTNKVTFLSFPSKRGDMANIFNYVKLSYIMFFHALILYGHCYTTIVAYNIVIFLCGSVNSS